MAINAGCIVVTEFTQNTDKKFSQYIDYIDRENAVRNNHRKKYMLDQLSAQNPKFQAYLEYMDNNEKTTGLFSSSSDLLTSSQKQAYKRQFLNAQKQGSVMWQTVISFDSTWLEEQNLYYRKTHTIAEEAMKRYARTAYSAMLEKEGLSSSAIWTAAIHYNKEHIHIHFAAVEPDPTRPIIESGAYAGQRRGKFKQSSINLCKSRMVNQIMQEKGHNEEITAFRNHFISKIRETELLKDKNLANDFLEIYYALPENRKDWFYNSNAMKMLRSKLDTLSTEFLTKYQEQDFQKFQIILKQQARAYRTAYGNTNKDFYDNKTKDLYARMGNTILQELKRYDNTIQKLNWENRTPVQQGAPPHRSLFLFKTQKALLQSISALRKGLTTDYEHFKNQRAYEALLRSEETDLS